MSDSQQNKGIPILDQLVEQNTPSAEDLIPKLEGESGETSGNVKSAFEATVETIVHEVLSRHLAKAREEITHEILTEVRARLQRKKPK